LEEKPQHGQAVQALNINSIPSSSPSNRKASRRKEKFSVVSVEQAVDEQKGPQQLICSPERVQRQLVVLIHHLMSYNSLECFHVLR
jgi:hypothetical protein